MPGYPRFGWPSASATSAGAEVLGLRAYRFQLASFVLFALITTVGSMV